jgi:aspartyl-tRNA(Asn)/glutamyl-tRNA(Gln) amidotransferase subunit B
MSYDAFEAVIGLEVHAQLLTKSKMFCRCSTQFGAADNENTCPVCMGMPGALPVQNKEAIRLAVRMGLALNCDIAKKSVFARKNYFYPDMPKNYQVSQYDMPTCAKGQIEFFHDKKLMKVGITRAHLEEDSGKSMHHGGHTTINLNRAGVPLLEIVSEPEMHTPGQAADYAKAIHQILIYLGVCDGNLEEGSMRCDCNVSVRKKGETKFGTKVELKNINSFRFVEKAIEYEIERQIDVIESGGKISQETRLYDVDKNQTFAMRSKEEAHDYRYFPEPDLLPLVLAHEWIEEIKQDLPELPVKKALRFQSEYQLPEYDSFVLTQDKDMAQYFESVAKISKNPKSASNWVMVELLRMLNDSKKSIVDSPIHASSLAHMIQLIDNQTISGKIAKTVFLDMWETGKEPDVIVKEKGLLQISDSSAIEKIVDEVVNANPNVVAEYKAGKTKLLGFFVGQIMKASKGQANPEMVNTLLADKLK